MQEKTRQLVETPDWQPLGANGEPIDPSKLPTQESFLYDMQHRFQGYGGGLGNGKCLRGDTLVQTVSGPVAIKDIEVGTLVYAQDEHKLVLRPVIRKIDSGVLPETKLVLENGMSVHTTPWHPYLRMPGTTRTSLQGSKRNGKDIRVRTPRTPEWARLDQCKPGDRIAVVAEAAQKVPRGRTKRFFSGDLEFVRISRIEPTGHDAQMYDLEIEGVHNFVANNIVAHNSTAGCLKAWYLSYLFPGNMGFIGRLDGKELRQTTMAEFRRLVPDKFVAKRNDQLGYIKFKPQYGGSEIIYGDLKEDRFNNINLGWFFIDQAEEIDVARFELLVSRLRRQTPLIGDDDKPLIADGQILTAPTYGFVTFNPEGTNSYIWRYFHPDSPERECTCHTGTSACKQHHFKLYQASTYDGLKAGFIPQDYVDGMLAVFPPDARRRYLEGSWDVFSGRIFPQFEQRVHVIDYVKAEPHWKIYESIDHGIKNPTAIGWWGVDEFGNRFLLDEHYEGDGKPVKYHAEVIKAKRAQFKQPITLTYLDSACWSLNQTRGDQVYSTVDEYNTYGIYPVKGQKDWDSAYSRICQGLTVDPQHVNPFTGEYGSPSIFVASHCTHFIKEVTGYRWKKNRITTQLRNKPEEPMDYNDHLMDSWYYFEGSRPQIAVVESIRTRNVLEEIKAKRLKYNPLADELSGSWMST